MIPQSWGDDSAHGVMIPHTVIVVVAALVDVAVAVDYDAVPL
jgi:hypothetical protein